MDTTEFKPSKITIRVKLIVIISSILIAALASIIFIATYFFKKDNELRVKENNIKLTEIISLNLNAEIRSLKQSLTVTIQAIQVSKDRETFIKTLLDREPSMLFSGVYDKSLSESFSIANMEKLKTSNITKDQLRKVVKSNEALFQSAFKGSTVLINASSGFSKPILAIGFPISKSNKDSIIISFMGLEKFLDSFQTSGITETYLVNEEGKIIAHSDISLVMAETNVASSPIVDRMRKSPLDNGQFRYLNTDNEWHLGSFKKLGLGGSGIIATVPEEKAFEEVYNIQRRNIYLMIAALNIAIIVVFFFARKISDPILSLVMASEKIASGNYNLNLKPKTRDEIGILTNSFQSMSQGLEEREKLKVSFGKFVNEDIAELSMRGELKVGGERKNCAILFSDIRSFTSISEKLRPEEVVEFLNEYMSSMVSCVKRNSGYVDKFIGDAIMATWGALKSEGNPSEQAVLATLEMRTALQKFNEGRGSTRKPKLNIGIGLNFGSVISGQIGSDEKMEYTVIGDAVNLASRVEGITKNYGLDILVSESIYENTKKKFRYESLDKIKVKGKSKPVDIYALLGSNDDPNCPKNSEDLRKIIGYKKPS